MSWNIPIWLAPLLGNVIAITFGIIAIQNWRKQNLPFRTRLKLFGFDLKTSVMREVSVGFSISTIAICSVFVIEWSFGILEITAFRFDIEELIKVLPIFAVGAVVEEFIYRGMMLSGILVLWSKKWLAVVCTAVLFGLIHIGNPNATELTVISTSLGGVMYALAYLWSERLWMPIGLHFAWNFIQGFILGFPVSGFAVNGIIEQTTTGDAIITGSTYGPEGGLIGISARVVVILLLFVWYKKHILNHQERT